MIFNDHSILLYRDYYWVILDCNHDYRLEHFPTLKFYFKNFEFNFHQWSNGIQWSFNTTAQGLLLWIITIIMDYNDDFRLKHFNGIQGSFNTTAQGLLLPNHGL